MLAVGPTDLYLALLAVSVEMQTQQPKHTVFSVLFATVLWPFNIKYVINIIICFMRFYIILKLYKE